MKILTWALIAAGVTWALIAAGAVGIAAIELHAAAQTTGQNIADEETPGGIPDGSLQFFTLRQVPVVLSTKLYVNGIRVTRGLDYAVYPSTKRIGFFPCCIPKAGDILRIDYRY